MYAIIEGRGLDVLGRIYPDLRWKNSTELSIQLALAYCLKFNPQFKGLKIVRHGNGWWTSTGVFIVGFWEVYGDV